MNWALLVMVCARWCEPQYVELFESKAECAKAKPADTKLFSTAGEKHYCIPAAKGEVKK